MVIDISGQQKETNDLKSKVESFEFQRVFTAWDVPERLDLKSIDGEKQKVVPSDVGDRTCRGMGGKNSGVSLL